MTHYEVLGVRADASTADIRRAYLVLARRHHPDFHASSGPAPVSSAEEQMRRINLAWEVLGEPNARAAYDRSLGLTGAVGTTGPGGVHIDRPSSEFRPYFLDDEDDDDSWRYEPDEGVPATAPPTAMLVAAPGLLVIGLALLALSLPTGARPLMVAGAACLGLAAILFVGTPVVAMFRSQMAEERASRRR